MCKKCKYKWFERSTMPPKRCPNHDCRTLHWNGFSPTKVSESILDRSILEDSKQGVIAKMRAEITSIEEKPKQRPTSTPPQLTRPDAWEEPTIT